MNLDASLVGVVFSLILFIIFFSAIILYLAFRIKETFREEKKRSSTVIKMVFLIGILFLAGGSFYFFANILQNMAGPTPTPGPTPVLSLTVSYPSSARVNTRVTVSFTVINPTTTTAHGATIQAPVLLANFVIQSSTHNIVGNVINIGDVPPGTTIASLELSAPNKARTVTDTVSLLYQESTAPVTQEISISVRGGP
ncbi:MAG: hypothetical protein Q8P64_05305 [Deltaproteobacteria bacterium]|nr:hypothetical protein [Deltaproteobacteria bacterium]